MTEVDTVRLDLPATHKYLNVVGACIGELLERVEGLHEPTVLTYNIQLAVHEICANIVDHAYGEKSPAGRIGITFTLQPVTRTMHVDLHDTGAAFDAERYQEPDLDAAQVRGYGLFLVKELMDDVLYETEANGNHWRLTKQL